MTNQFESAKLKKPTSISEQIDILISRGLIVNHKTTAEDILSRVSYYRLSAYMLHLKKDNQFNDKVSIEEIYALYEFDKKFRNLVVGLLESIEIAFRTQIAYTLAHHYGATSYLNHSNFMNEDIHRETVFRLRQN